MQYQAGDRSREEQAGAATRNAALLAFQANALDLISDAVIVVGPRQEVVYFGPGAERLYGIAAQDAIGRPLQSCYQFIWDTPQAEAAAMVALSEEGRWRGENTHVLRNGEKRRVESTVTMMRDEAGKQCGMLAVIRDISKRWRLEQLLRDSEERYRELFERLAVEHAALARLHQLSARLASQDDLETLLDTVLDAAMDLMAARRGTFQMYDSSTDSLSIVSSRGFEKEFLDFYAVVHREVGCCGKAMDCGERVIVEDVRRSPLFVDTPAAAVMEAAQVRAVQSTPLRGRDGKLLGIISTYWPEPHRLEDSAFRMFDLLAREAADLIEHRQREQGLRESGRRKDEFLAILSHELRNPLSAISTGVSLLERAPPGSDQAKRAVGVIERQARQMGRLIEDLLDLTRISSGKIRLQHQSVELNQLLRRTADDQLALFDQNGVHLELELSNQTVYVNGDEVRLAQVVENLLHNCSKFTPRGGWARLSLEVGENAKAIIRVSDNGLGISPETLPKVFEPFVQAEATLARSKGGLGLGLAVVKGLVEIHNGTVTAASRGAGSGTEITIRLPLDATKTSPIQSPKNARGGPNRRILIIEDNVDVAATLRDLLETMGHEIAMAHNGADGIAVAKDFRPDVVLCDIGLPEMDGYEVARILRADKVLEGAQLVALSGYALPSDLKRAAEAGFDCHVPKPPSVDRLEELLIRPRG